MNSANHHDPYERILENMRQYPNDIPMVNGGVSEAFRAYIQLLFTPEEAQVAQYLKLRPIPGGRVAQWVLNRLFRTRFIQKAAMRQSIRTVSLKIGRSAGETRSILEGMTQRGVIQDIGGYSYFLTMPHLFNIGFKYSKALERLGKRGAELYQQFFVTEKYYKRYQSSDKGTSMSRIIPVKKAIHHQSEIQPAEELHNILDCCMEPIVITDCPCRNRKDILGERECRDKYPIRESCFQVGLFGEYFLRRGEGRRLERQEAHDMVDRFAALGLIFTTENTRDPNRFVICCCCECCCALIRGMTRFEEKNEFCTAKSNYLASVDGQTCKGCGRCVQRCAFHAVMMHDDKARVDHQKCYGCGVCAVTCPAQAIRLHQEPRSPIYANGLELMSRIYRENRD